MKMINAFLMTAFVMFVVMPFADAANSDISLKTDIKKDIIKVAGTCVAWDPRCKTK